MHSPPAVMRVPACSTCSVELSGRQATSVAPSNEASRETGGQGVAGSNPVSPTVKTLVDDHKSSARVLCFSGPHTMITRLSHSDLGSSVKPVRVPHGIML